MNRLMLIVAVLLHTLLLLRYNDAESISAPTIANARRPPVGAHAQLSGESVSVSSSDPDLSPDAGANTQTWKYKLEVISRSIYLGVLFSPLMLTALLAFVSAAFRRSVWFPLLASTVGNSGAAFTKWGQWASTRPDMFPIELCKALERLQAGAPVHNFRYTKQQVELELGRPLRESFDYFDPVPLASGSIAQVHRAVLNGTLVAVKVRHPNVEMHIKIDFDLMHALAYFLESVLGLEWMRLSESLAQFSKTIASQVHLEVEGKHLHKFLANFKGWHDVGFPRPLLVSNSVLVETFESGVSAASIADIVRLERRKHVELAHFAVIRGEDLYLKMLVEDGLMHADLHPGNILLDVADDQGRFDVRASTSSNSFEDRNSAVRRHLTLVDAGMVAELTDDETSNFIGLLEALGEGRGDEAAECVLRFTSNRENFPREQDSPSRQQQISDRNVAFTSDMQQLFTRVCRGYGTKVDIGEVLRGILGLVRVHRVGIEANYATLVMNALCLDGLAKSMLPDYNVLDGAKLLLRWNRRCKRLPRWVARRLFKLLLPVVRWRKSAMDRVQVAALTKQT